MRVELVEDKKKKVNWWQAVPTIITAFVAVIGIVVSCLTYSSQKAATIEDREAQRVADRSNRFTYAIEHLKDESLAIRMGALFELQKLGLEDEGLQENIVRILTPFIREGIENRDLLIPPKTEDGLPQPNEDIFLACEAASTFELHTRFPLYLPLLEARGIDLQEFDLQGAILYGADLQGASLNFTNLQRVDLRGADLRGALWLTAEQLLEAQIDDTTLLDPNLRAKYERLKAAQE